MPDYGFTNPTLVQRMLNDAMPANKHGRVGDVIAGLISFCNSLQAAHTTFCITKAGLVIHGASSTLVKAGSPTVAVVAGALVDKAANTDMPALVGTLPTAKSALWAFYIDSAETLHVSTMTVAATTHDGALALLPAIPAGYAQLGFIIVDNATGSNFVGGTTALDVGSLTVTYYDTMGIQPSAIPAALKLLGQY